MQTGTGDQGEVNCACGRGFKLFAALSMHRRCCDLVKRLLIQPVSEMSAVIDLNHTRSSSIVNNNRDNSIIGSDNLISNPIYCSHVESDNLHSRINVNCATAKNMQAKESLQPLAGVKLPKTIEQWNEMNAYFYSASLFRFASGKIDDLDSAAAEFNNSIYGYLAKRHGTLKSTKKIFARGRGAKRPWTKNINRGPEAD